MNGGKILIGLGQLKMFAKIIVMVLLLKKKKICLVILNVLIKKDY